MVIEVSTVGGYNEVGKNMTAIKVGEIVMIMDMGLHIENYVRVRGEDDGFGTPTVVAMQKADAIPDDRCIEDWRKKVRMIVPTHAHLDHVGAIPYMGNRYDAPIVGTPFTIEVIKSILTDEKIKIKNELKVLNANSRIRVNNEVSLEFVNITHSTPQTVVGVIHTPDGAVVYANDFKLDNNPTLGAKPNYDRLRELGKEGVQALIVDGTRATRSGKTPSESIAKEMLRDVMLGSDLKDGLIIVTTFSSHIARLKSIIEFGKKLNRKIVFLGRSLGKYVAAAEEIGLVSFSEEVEIVRYGNQVKRRLKQIAGEKRNRYLLVMTGHQGEPESVLSRIATHEIQFDLNPEDSIIFSCSVIPNPSNVANRELLESQLKRYKVRMFKDIHTSGHASREDLRDMINMLKPRHIIPAHGDFTMISALTDLAMEMNYKVGQNLHIMRNGQRVKIE